MCQPLHLGKSYAEQPQDNSVPITIQPRAYLSESSIQPFQNAAHPLDQHPLHPNPPPAAPTLCPPPRYNPHRRSEAAQSNLLYPES